MTRGLTFSIQRFSTEDGPGIRTTVFFKGCPLRCAWCHNPEGLLPRPELMWYDLRCIGARDCLRACPEGSLCLSPEGLRIDRMRCTGCGDCAAACPAGALEVIGQEWSADDLLAEILKDEVFFNTSAGGVTFSGGEPAMQADFLTKLLPRCREAGLHVALDTCGCVAWDQYASLLPWVDLVLYDLKIMDPEQHRAATGRSNELIIENAFRLARTGISMWVRTPIVPGYTAGLNNVEEIARFIHDELPAVERWDLLPYTSLGQPKYRRLDRTYALEGRPSIEPDEMEAVGQCAVMLAPVARWRGGR